MSGPKDEATGLQSEGRSLTLLGHIFSERVTFQFFDALDSTVVG